MVALDARVRLLGPRGERTIPLAELYRLPGDQPDRETRLEPAELITAVELPPLAPAANSDYRKVRDRASFAFALVSVAAALEIADGHVAASRIAFGGVAPIPWRASRAERALRGAPATEESFARAAAAELDLARPLPENAFKVTLAANLLVQTLLDLSRT
jgi:xanthine dehydrogenase YagS FAD-binding subunit